MVMDAVGAVAGAVMDMLKNEKAKLEVVGDNTPDGDQSVECMFNPTEYSLSQSMSVQPSPTAGKPGGNQEYTGTSPMTLKAKLFFDDFASIDGDVTPKISTLFSWTRPTKKSAGKPQPPLVRFVWGGNPELDEFQGFLQSVDVTYSVFRKDGTPVQATASITIQGVPPKAKKQNPTSHAANSRRVHTVIEGDTLQSIAHRELGKPAYWRAIADLNDLDDPMRLGAGTELLIPSVADAARTA